MEKSALATTSVEEKHSFSWTGLIVWPFIILFLYVLSIGPVMALDAKGRISPNNKLLKVYAPLDWAYDETALHKPLGMYLHLWAPKYFDKNGDGGY